MSVISFLSTRQSFRVRVSNRRETSDFPIGATVFKLPSYWTRTLFIMYDISLIQSPNSLLTGKFFTAILVHGGASTPPAIAYSSNFRQDAHFHALWMGSPVLLSIYRSIKRFVLLNLDRARIVSIFNIAKNRRWRLSRWILPDLDSARWINFFHDSFSSCFFLFSFIFPFFFLFYFGRTSRTLSHSLSKIDGTFSIHPIHSKRLERGNISRAKTIARIYFVWELTFMRSGCWDAFGELLAPE